MRKKIGRVLHSINKSRFMNLLTKMQVNPGSTLAGQHNIHIWTVKNETGIQFLARVLNPPELGLVCGRMHCEVYVLVAGRACRCAKHCRGGRWQKRSMACGAVTKYNGLEFLKSVKAA